LSPWQEMHFCNTDRKSTTTAQSIHISPPPPRCCTLLAVYFWV
jgi:hypothetical protein